MLMSMVYLVADRKCYFLCFTILKSHPNFHDLSNASADLVTKALDLVLLSTFDYIYFVKLDRILLR